TETGALSGSGHDFSCCECSVASVARVVAELDVALVVRVVLDLRDVEVDRAVLEAETQGSQLLADLADRLGPEVADVEKIGLAAGDQLPDGVDALALEAVVRARLQPELLDGEREVRGQGGVGRRGADLDALGLDVELAGQAEELDERLAGGGERVARGDRVL